MELDKRLDDIFRVGRRRYSRDELIGHGQSRSTPTANCNEPGQEGKDNGQTIQKAHRMTTEMTSLQHGVNSRVFALRRNKKCPIKAGPENTYSTF